MDRNSGGQAAVEAATAFMRKIHEGQVASDWRDGSRQSRLEEIARIVDRAGGDSKEVVAALLQDSVRHGGATLEEVASNFGEEVAEIVKCLNDSPGYDDLVALANYVPQMSSKTKRIVVATLITQLDALAEDLPKDWSREKCREYIEAAKEIVESAATGISMWSLGRSFLDACRKAEKTLFNS